MKINESGFKIFNGNELYPMADRLIIKTNDDKAPNKIILNYAFKRLMEASKAINKWSK